MKKIIASLLTLTFLPQLTLIAQRSANKFWLPINEVEIRVSGDRQIIPQVYKTYRLNGTDLKTALFSSPLEKTTPLSTSNAVIVLPNPNGSLQRFKVIESPIMAEELSAAYPNIKTFAVKGIDDPYASGRLDWNLYGFHGMIMSPSGDYFIDPYCIGNLDDYTVYYTANFVKNSEHMLPESIFETSNKQKRSENDNTKNGSSVKEKTAAINCVGTHLRTYRLAVACTGEYAKAATASGTAIPTIAQVLSKINTSINRVNGVYETEVAVRLVLVATETNVIFADPTTDPFNGNNNSNTLIGESQTIITNTIGSSNFDIGHTFSTGGGGLANLGVVCNNSSKARGITGSSNPVGDPYDIDYVSHEMGHQFDADHTFNAVTGSCGGGNRAAGSAVEPGSGITIMAYAGICPGNNVANNSIAYFHAVSYDQIVNFTQSGSGNSCPVVSATGNNPPVVSLSNYTVPVATPFFMTGSANDPDGDKLSYSWEETDAGFTGENWNIGNKPYFRSYAPDTPQVHGSNSFTRYFPKLVSVIANNFTGVIGEYLPQSAQTLNFRLTARDKKMGGGGVCSASNTLTIDASGPFSVSYPSATGIHWLINTQQNVTWNVNGTNASPVSCDSVRIFISYNSGNSFSVLVNSTPNDGTETITAPTLTSSISTCKIKVQSIGNVFYDMSDNNFTIVTSVSELGLKKVSEDNPHTLQLWPNPFNDQVTVVAGNLDLKNKTTLVVFDVLGKIVLEENYSSKSELKETLNLSELNKGVYFLRISNNNKQSAHRLVKQ